MAKRAETRLALLRAAEELFAAHGVDAVSLREVASQAGQKNVSAVHYHFGDRRELLECVLERHSGPMQELFADRLKDGEDSDDARSWVELLVQTLVAKLDDKDGGPAYLRLCAQLTASEAYPLTRTRSATAPGALALSQKLMSYSSGCDPQIFPLRWMLFGNALYLSIADYMRLSSAGMVIGRELFVSHLVDSLMRIADIP